MPERVSYGTSRSGERSTNGPYVSLSSAMSLLSQPSPHRAPRLRLVGHVSARTAFSALASPCASPTARRPRLSSNCFLSPRLTVRLAYGSSATSQLELLSQLESLTLPSPRRREDVGR